MLIVQQSEMSKPPPMVYQCLLLLQQVRDLTGSNKALNALWTNKDSVMRAVLKLFTLCRGDASESMGLPSDTIEAAPSPATIANNAQNAPMELIHSLILDLLAEVDESMMAEAPLPKVSRKTSELVLMIARGSSETCYSPTYPVRFLSDHEPSDQAEHFSVGNGSRSVRQRSRRGACQSVYSPASGSDGDRRERSSARVGSRD